MSMSYRSDPFVKMPPGLPMPGDLFVEGSTGRSLPPYQGSIYTFVCKFWSIAYKMNCQYFHKGAVSLDTAELIFQQLLDWSDNLQEDMKRGEQSPDYVCNLQYVVLRVLKT
jgi:hypothetical protein